MIVLPPPHSVNCNNQAQPLRICSENIGNRFYSELPPSSSFNIISNVFHGRVNPQNSDNSTTTSQAASPAAGNASVDGAR